jgi:hypothetical protein
MCSRWVQSDLHVFLNDIGLNEQDTISNDVAFHVESGAQELNPATVTATLSPRTHYFRRHYSPRTIGIAQAGSAAQAALLLRWPVPKFRRFKGHIGALRQEDLVRGSYIHAPDYYAPKPLRDSRAGQPIYSEAALIHDVIPNLVAFIDAIGTYLKPTGKTRRGLPIHEGTMPLGCRAKGFGVPQSPRITRTSDPGWRMMLLEIFTQPHTIHSGMPLQFLEHYFGKRGAKQRLKLLHRPDATYYTLGRHQDDNFFSLTTPDDFKRNTVTLRLVGHLDQLTQAMRSALLAVAMRTSFGRSTPTPRRYDFKAQLDYLQTAAAQTDTYENRADLLANFPRLFDFPPLTPELQATHTRLFHAYDEWRHNRPDGHTVWPPNLKTLAQLGYLQTNSAGAITHVLVPPRLKPYQLQLTPKQLPHNTDFRTYAKRIRYLDWDPPSQLKHPTLQDEVLALLALQQAIANAKNSDITLPIDHPTRTPLGAFYTHPVSLPAYQWMLANLRTVRRNSTGGTPSRRLTPQEREEWDRKHSPHPNRHHNLQISTPNIASLAYRHLEIACSN